MYVLLVGKFITCYCTMYVIDKYNVVLMMLMGCTSHGIKN